MSHQEELPNIENARHIISLSGGKDSTALAIHMRDRIADLEYVFCDTEKELPETYDFLKQLEAYLGKPITYLKHDGRGFDDLLLIRRGFLPSPQVRWCTEYLKIKPFERFIGDDLAYTYIGIRADEQQRKGYISTKPNIKARYPFIEDSVDRADVIRILEDSGLGLPKYYKWRSRSGCYFCFFQRKVEWAGLLENHPDLYELAISYEKQDDATGESYTWSDKGSLKELANPEKIAQTKAEHARFLELQGQKHQANLSLSQIFESDTSSVEEGCLICHL